VTASIHPIVDVARRFTIDWLDRADASVPPMIMTSGYRVHIGDVELDGLPSYPDGTVGQLRQFPGLGRTVHDVVTDGERLALVFTEHGASTKHGGNAAGWAGVALFRWDGARLIENWTQEDYYARRRQLADGVPDVIRPPAPAPWTTPPRPSDPEIEWVVRDWLATPVLDQVTVDDGRADELSLDVDSVEVLEQFSAGDQVAFAAVWSGKYRGGLDGVPPGAEPADLGVAGVLTVHDGSVVGGSIVTDRLGLRRRLRPRR
jgi:predicted ester cyclase